MSAETGATQGVASLVGFREGRAEGQDTSSTDESYSSLMQGLNPNQLEALARKVYALMLDEMRIETERHGRILMR